MKSLSALLTLAALAATSALAQMSQPMVSENTTRISDHVWANMGFPNIAIVVGSHATLVVDTGLGPKNGATAARVAARLAPNNLKLFLTTTHFHPEHAAGEPGFPPGTILIRNAVQQQEMEKHIQELGKAAVLDADVPMPHEKIVHLLGRLRFRTSYSQNVLQHSVEVAHLCGMMASELGLNPQLARRCGLLHDVGKAADHEMEGGHPKIGAELARRYGETSKEVIHAIAGHHDDVTIDHVYTVLVAAADAISASRPGARRETLEKYVKRLEELEALKRK